MRKNVRYFEQQFKQFPELFSIFMFSRFLTKLKNYSLNWSGRWIIQIHELFAKNKFFFLLEFQADQSLMTFEGTQIQGAAKIMEKIQSLTFQKIAHVITAVDCQPTFDGGILINVLGQLKVCNLLQLALFSNSRFTSVCAF